MDEIKLNAMLQELGNQRMLLGDRCVAFAATNAALVAENEKLKARIAELENPKDEAVNN